MPCMRSIDRLRWRLCLFLALCCSFYAVGAASALAFTLDADLSSAQAQLPEGHPCKAPGSIAVSWVPGLRSYDRTVVEDGEAPQAYLVGGRWLAKTITGQWIALPCEIRLDTAAWARSSECRRRRLVIHEGGHLGGLHDSTGIMSTFADIRERVTVPGCPAVLEPLRDRITTAVLDRVPRGWEVSCGPRRGRVLRCTADHGRRSRAYRARLSDQTGTTFTITRVKSQ